MTFLNLETSTPQRNLLIIDDEEDACLLIARLLRYKFSHIECAYSLAEGREKAGRVKPDVVLLDNNLPDGMGIDHINDFKKICSNPVQVVVISALDIRSEALTAGADEFIGKPIDVGDFPW